MTYNGISIKYIKFILLLLILFQKNFADEKIIKKIVSDEVEYNRKDKTTKFSGKVKVELIYGTINCQRAVYDEKNYIINCESQVYAVLFSTKDNTVVEIKSEFAKFNEIERILEFSGNPYVIYTSTDITKQAKLYCEKIVFNEKTSVMLCEKNVSFITQDGQLYCETAQYDLNTKELFLNHNLGDQNISSAKIKFVSTNEEYNIKSFVSTTGKINFQQDTILLSGKVEVVF